MQMQIDEAFSELLGLLYQGPLEDPPWSGFLQQFREVLGAQVASIFLLPSSQQQFGVMLNVGGEDAGIASYEERLYTLDPFVDLPLDQVVTLRDFLGEQALLESEFYRLSMAPSGLADGIGADVKQEGLFEARIRACRAHGTTPFGTEESALIQALLPHFKRAMTFHVRLNRIESERAVYAGAVEQLAVATFILDDKGRLLDCNEQGKRLLAEEDGVALEEGQLRLFGKAETAELQRLIEHLLLRRRNGVSSLAEAMHLKRPSGRADLGVVLRPVPRGQWSEGESVPAVVIFISDPEQASEAPVQVIIRLFGFTPTEAQLAMHLANGLTLDEAAAEMGVSRNTARTHLRALFSKTGVSRQTMLVRLILKSVAPLASGNEQDAPRGA